MFCTPSNHVLYTLFNRVMHTLWSRYWAIIKSRFTHLLITLMAAILNNVLYTRDNAVAGVNVFSPQSYVILSLECYGNTTNIIT